MSGRAGTGRWEKTGEFESIMVKKNHATSSPSANLKQALFCMQSGSDVPPKGGSNPLAHAQNENSLPKLQRLWNHPVRPFLLQFLGRRWRIAIAGEGTVPPRCKEDGDKDGGALHSCGGEGCGDDPTDHSYFRRGDSRQRRWEVNHVECPLENVIVGNAIRLTALLGACRIGSLSREVWGVTLRSLLKWGAHSGQELCCIESKRSAPTSHDCWWVKSNPLTLMNIRSSSALLLLLFTAAAPFQAMAVTYLATWSGASYGNAAQAIARVEIDEGALVNPSSSFGPLGPGTVVTSVDLTVSGAASGNGTWDIFAFSDYSIEIVDALNLGADWIGQPQPTGGSVWGRVGGFNLYSPVAGVPTGTDPLELTTASGTGDNMRLVSFAPISFGGPGARFNVGDTVALDLSVLIERALVPNGAAGESVRLVGLPAGVVFDPATFLLSGRVLGLVGASGVKIEVRKGSKVLRSLPYNLAVDPYPYAGGFEVLLEGPASASPNFTNTDGITINDNGDATPYPSAINVGGINLPVTAVRVKLNGLNHTFLGDLDLFLMAPDGKVSAVMSDVGGGDDAVNANLIFADAAAASFPTAPTGIPYTTGTFKPTDLTPGGLGEIPPGTVGAVGTSLNALAAGNVNGQWKLFVRDDAVDDFGSMTSWALEFDLRGPIGKIKVTLASPTTRSLNPAYSAIIERMGHPRRTARGVITLTPGTTQAVSVTVPATRTLPQAIYDLTIDRVTDHVTGVQNGDPTVTARGFRLIRPHRIPTGNVALNLGFFPNYTPDGVLNPGGVGHGTSTVTTAGLIPIRGLLGDAQPFTGTLCLSQTSEAVVWLTPYPNKSSYVGGILTITQGSNPVFGFLPGRNPAPPAPISGGLRWNVRPDAKAKAYSGGFGPLSLNPFVSLWSPLRTAEDLGRSLDLSFRNLMINYLVPPATMMGEVLPITGMPTQWVLRDNLTLVNVSAGTHPTTARANPKNGTFAGTIKLPAPATRTTVSGIFAQDSFIFPFPGMGLFKVPVSGPGLPAGAYRTAGYYFTNQ